MDLYLSYCFSLIFGGIIIGVGVYELYNCSYYNLYGFNLAKVIITAILTFLGFFSSIIQFFLPNEYTSQTNTKINDTKFKGPYLFDAQPINNEFAIQLFNLFKNGNGETHLHSYYCNRILKEAIDILKSRKSLTELNILEGKSITIVGDIHGQFFDLCRLFEINGLPSINNCYVFNGDLVDRGFYGIETTLTLLCFMIACPESIYIAKGNHETSEINMLYGFRAEVNLKYDDEMYQQFCTVFRWLPYAHLINKEIFIVHGGIPATCIDIKDINNIIRGVEPEEYSLETELIWNDPKLDKGSIPKFMQNNKLSKLIRSHEVKLDGYEWIFDDQLLTLFSAPNYCDSVMNKAAYAHITLIQNKLDVTLKTFEYVQHPPTPEIPRGQFWKEVEEIESINTNLFIFSLITLF
ncbi:serine/threonine protein phosphatase [Entamoeba marina]